MTTKVIPVHIPLPLVEKVDQMAAHLERSRGRIDQEEKRRRLTIEALADVDAGQVIDHQSVQAWVEYKMALSVG